MTNRLPVEELLHIIRFEHAERRAAARLRRATEADPSIDVRVPDRAVMRTPLRAPVRDPGGWQPASRA
jgi:hypothetical protein